MVFKPGSSFLGLSDIGNALEILLSLGFVACVSQVWLLLLVDLKIQVD